MRSPSQTERELALSSSSNNIIMNSSSSSNNNKHINNSNNKIIRILILTFATRLPQRQCRRARLSREQAVRRARPRKEAPLYLYMYVCIDR